DGGATWANTTADAGLSDTAAYSDLVINPDDNDVLYAAVGTATGSDSNSVYESTDGGPTWDRSRDLPPEAFNGEMLGRITLAISHSDPDVVYASVATTGGDLLGIWKTTDAGVNWNELDDSMVPIPNYLAGQGDYDTTLAVDPADSHIIYAGGG